MNNDIPCILTLGGLDTDHGTSEESPHHKTLPTVWHDWQSPYRLPGECEGFPGQDERHMQGKHHAAN